MWELKLRDVIFEDPFQLSRFCYFSFSQIFILRQLGNVSSVTSGHVRHISDINNINNNNNNNGNNGNVNLRKRRKLTVIGGVKIRFTAPQQQQQQQQHNSSKKS